MAPVKRKRVSKKNKKSWRKNVDLKDVDNFLEDQRLEERLGIKHGELKDDDLFLLDTKGDDENTRNTVKVPKYKLSRTRGSLRLKETELPKCFSALLNKSAVRPHIIKKSRTRKEDSKSAVAREIIKRNSKKEVLKAKNKIENWENEKNQSIPWKFDYDVWAKENNERDLNGCSEWLSKDTIRHTLHNTGQLKKQTPKTILSKTSLLPAVEVPHAGLSYNPSLKDHQDVLRKVAEAEEEVIKEEKHLQRVTTKMFDKKSRNQVEQQWLSEMTVGLSMEKTQSDEDEEEDDDGEYKTVNPPVRNKKKTAQKRRHLKEAQLLKEKLRQKKVEKKKLSDLHRLKKFKEMLDKKEEKTRRNMEKRKKLKEQKLYATKTLSQVKYQEPEIDFNLAEELPGNMRRIQPEGNLLLDRFKSLQKRNILQPTMKRTVKKRKMKKYERESTKMGWEPKGYEPFVKPERRT